jgi:ATP-binding cassette, subfamily C (CFTR/MRP), member 1
VLSNFSASSLVHFVHVIISVDLRDPTAWENPYYVKLAEFRRRELGHVRALLVLRALTQSIAMSIPVLSTVLAFMTYSLLGNQQNPAIIFTSFTLFSILRMPLMVRISV